MTTNLVYYFAFPHYRREILQSLSKSQEPHFEFVAGRNSRENIAALSEDDVDGLEIVRSFRLGPISWERGVFRRAISKKYDSVILGPATLSLTTWAVLAARSLTRRKVFLWGQCGRYGDRSLKRWVQEAMNRMATGVLVYGENEAKAAGQLGLAPRKITVVHNATRSNADVLNSDESSPALRRAQDAAREAKDTGRVRLLFVGRINGSKRLDVLLRAAATLREQYGDLEIDLIGDGDARATLSQAFSQPWIHFHGWIYDPDELDRYFRNATLVCSPYHMGLLAIDALRAGSPVLAPDNPMNGSEVEALTPLVNSVRFTPGDSNSIVVAANVWLDLVQEIDLGAFNAARQTALNEWDPAGVALSIQKATKAQDNPGRVQSFLWLTGHVRNVGDSMLRRPLTEIYREVGPISVWTGAPGSGYEAGLKLAPQESARSFAAWVRSYYAAALRGRPTFVFNAGEFGVTKAYFVGMILLAPALALTTLKGGHIVWAGAGVNRRRRRVFMLPFDMLARAADYLKWRDVKAPKVMGRGTTMPDWGFGLGPGGGSARTPGEVDGRSRDFIAISLRGDRREPSPEWVSAVGRLAERLGSKIVCVVQVQEDHPLAARLAAELGASLVGWGDGDHWLQELRVREAYAQSRLVLSDRLHGLIIAASEGAVPLAWCEATTDKIAKHFEVVGATWVAPRPGDSSTALVDELMSDELERLTRELAQLMVLARDRVDQVRQELLALENTGRRPKGVKEEPRAQ